MGVLRISYLHFAVNLSILLIQGFYAEFRDDILQRLAQILFDVEPRGNGLDTMENRRVLALEDFGYLLQAFGRIFARDVHGELARRHDRGRAVG